MFKWLADFLGIGRKPEPIKEEAVKVTAPAVVHEPATDVIAKVETKPAVKPAAKAAKNPKSAAKTTKATTKKSK